MSRIPSKEELLGGPENIYCQIGQHLLPNRSTSTAKSTDLAVDVDVTVVTVCFNPLKSGRKEQFLKNLDSVQAQENVRLEHLIIDGNSSDGTFEWLKTYNAKRHDIRILSKPDSGIYDAMNRGIALARGRYVIFLNSDDYFHNPFGMALSLERVEEMQCDFTFAPICFSDPSVRRNPQLAPQKRIHRFLISWCFSHQSMLTSRSFLMKIDGFDTSYRSAADYDLLLRMVVAGAKGCFVPHAFSTFTLGGFSALQENKKLIEDECIRCLQAFFHNLYALDMTHDEAEYIFRHRVFPRKYLNIYKHLQKYIRKHFIGIPESPAARLSQWFNYIKYYLKCLRSNA